MQTEILDIQVHAPISAHSVQIPTDLPKELQQAIRQLGFTALYSHQVNIDKDLKNESAD
jgi:hypothetical protein